MMISLLRVVVADLKTLVMPTSLNLAITWRSKNASVTELMIYALLIALSIYDGGSCLSLYAVDHFR